MFPSTQNHCGISSVTFIRHGRNTFVDPFNKDSKEDQKNDWRSAVSCESGKRKSWKLDFDLMYSASS